MFDLQRHNVIDLELEVNHRAICNHQSICFLSNGTFSPRKIFRHNFAT